MSNKKDRILQKEGKEAGPSRKKKDKAYPAVKSGSVGTKYTPLQKKTQKTLTLTKSVICKK